MSFRVQNLLSTAVIAACSWHANAAETVSLQKLHTQMKSQKTSAVSLMSQLNLGALSSLKMKSEKASKSGARLQKLEQYYDGLRVLDHTAIVGTDAAGEINRLHGYVAQGLEKDIKSTQTKITVTEAIDYAKAAHKDLYKVYTGWNYSNVESKKSIFVSKQGKAAVVFKISFFADNKTGLNPSRPFIMIDGVDGSVVDYVDALAFAETEATGPGGNEKTGKYDYGTDYPALIVTADKDEKTCTFSTENVKTVDLKNEGTGNPGGDSGLNTSPHEFDCSENTDRPINGAFSPLNDAHFFGTVVFNMYQKWYDLNPLKTDLTLRVHYGNEFENAFWDGKQMTFGDGKDYFYPLVVLDVTAHEVSHGFTEFNSGLAYASQSGGINEAFSDMAGEAAEFFMKGKNDWLVGGEIAKEMEALRFMDDPTKDGKSIADVKDFKEPSNQFFCLLCQLGGGGGQCAEYCGTDVHHSSGVFNKVYHDVATSKDWDTHKAFDVFVKANQDYWSEQTNFEDGAKGVMDAADDLGYDTKVFKDAFKDVGINL